MTSCQYILKEVGIEWTVLPNMEEEKLVDQENTFLLQKELEWAAKAGSMHERI